MEDAFHAYDIDNSISYFARYLSSLTLGIVRKHKPDLDTRLPQFESQVTLNENTDRKWCSLFDTDPELNAPFTRYIPTSSQAIIEYVKRLNIRYQNLVFAASHIDFLTNDKGSRAENDIHLRYRYCGAESVNRASSVACFSTEVTGLHSRPLVRQTDYFYLRKSPCNTPIENATVRQIRSMPRKRRRLSKQDLIGEFFIWKRMGLDFGKLSGDLNLLHILDSTARFTNKSRGFVQGLCTLNIIIGLMWQRYPQGLASLSIFYSRPVLHDQNVFLLCDGRTFELIDEKDQLVAFGEIISTDSDSIEKC